MGSSPWFSQEIWPKNPKIDVLGIFSGPGKSLKFPGMEISEIFHGP